MSIGERIEEVLVHTGQHYDDNMSAVFFKEMQIPTPRYHLGIGGGTHGAMTGRMLESLEGLMVEEKPDVVLVYGDTNIHPGRCTDSSQTTYSGCPCGGRTEIL